MSSPPHRQRFSHKHSRSDNASKTFPEAERAPSAPIAESKPSKSANCSSPREQPTNDSANTANWDVSDVDDDVEADEDLTVVAPTELPANSSRSPRSGSAELGPPGRPKPNNHLIPKSSDSVSQSNHTMTLRSSQNLQLVPSIGSALAMQASRSGAYRRSSARGQRRDSSVSGSSGGQGSQKVDLSDVENRREFGGLRLPVRPKVQQGAKKREKGKGKRNGLQESGVHDRKITDDEDQ